MILNERCFENNLSNVSHSLLLKILVLIKKKKLSIVLFYLERN